jgi:hypothetical protein
MGDIDEALGTGLGSGSEECMEEDFNQDFGLKNKKAGMLKLGIPPTRSFSLLKAVERTKRRSL